MRWSVVASGRGASGVAAKRRAAVDATGSLPAPMTATRSASIAANAAAAARSGERGSVGVMSRGRFVGISDRPVGRSNQEVGISTQVVGTSDHLVGSSDQQVGNPYRMVGEAHRGRGGGRGPPRRGGARALC